MIEYLIVIKLMRYMIYITEYKHSLNAKVIVHYYHIYIAEVHLVNSNMKGCTDLCK